MPTPLMIILIRLSVGVSCARDRLDRPADARPHFLGATLLRWGQVYDRRSANSRAGSAAVRPRTTESSSTPCWLRPRQQQHHTHTSQGHDEDRLSDKPPRVNFRIDANELIRRISVQIH